MKLFVVNCASSLSTKIVQIIVLIWVNRFLLMRVPTEEYALFPLVLALMLCGELFCQIFTGGVTRQLVEADSKGNENGVERVVSSISPLLMIATMILLLGAGIVVGNIDSVFSLAKDYRSDAQIMLALLAFNLGLKVVMMPFTSGLYVKNLFVRKNSIELVAEVIRVLCVVSLLFGMGAAVVWLVVASTVSTIIDQALKFVYSRKAMPTLRLQWRLFDWQTVKKSLVFGGWTTTSGIANLAKRTGPLFLLNHFSVAIEVVFFHLGKLVDTNVRRLMASATVPVQPFLIRRCIENGDEGIDSLYYRGGKYFLWTGLFICAPLVVFGSEVAVLYAGEDYAESGLVMALFLLCFPFDFSNSMYYRVAHAKGCIGAFSRVEITSSVLLVSCVYFVVFYGGGAVEIAFTSLIICLVKNVGVNWRRALRLVNGTWHYFFRRTLLPGLSPFFVSMMICLWLKRILGPNDWQMIGGCFFVSAVFYVIVIVSVSMDRFDRSICRKAKRGVLGIWRRNTV